MSLPTAPSRLLALAPGLLAALAGVPTGLDDEPATPTHDLRPAARPAGPLVTRVTIASTGTLESMRVVVDGREVPQADVGERVIRGHLRTTWRDRALGPDEVRRTFSQAEQGSELDLVDPAGVARTSTTRRTSPVLGAAVTFVRDDGVWSPRSALADDAQAPPPWISGLVLSPDLTACLPAGPVAVGDRWEVDVDLLGQLREPGGDLSWELVGQSPAVPEVVAPPGSTTYAGKLEATLVAVDGDTARLRLDVAALARLDLTPWLPGSAEGGGDPGGQVGEGDPDDEGVESPVDDPEADSGDSDRSDGPELEESVLVTRLAGEGTLTWDLAGGHPRRLVLDLAGREVETAGFGRAHLAPGLPGLGVHDVELEMISESRYEERVVVEVGPPEAVGTPPPGGQDPGRASAGDDPAEDPPGGDGHGEVPSAGGGQDGDSPADDASGRR